MSISCSNVGVRLSGTDIVEDVSLSVRSGEWLTIIGPNGAGKSTLLRALVGLVSHTGEVSINGNGAGPMSRRERSANIAYLPQSPVTPPRMTVLDYVLLGVAPRLGMNAWPGEAEAKEAMAALSRFGLDSMANRWIDSLSGGERQMALVARAMVQRADTLVLDEPTTALDLGHQQQVLDAVHELRRSDGVAVLATMHDLGLASHHGDRLILLSSGKVVAEGSATEVIDAELIGKHYGAVVDVIEHDNRLLVVPATSKDD